MLFVDISEVWCSFDAEWVVVKIDDIVTLNVVYSVENAMDD